MSSATTFDELIKAGALEIGDGYRAKLEELGEGGPFFLRAVSVADGRIDYDNNDRFKASLSERVAPKRGHPGDTVITTKGASTGRAAFVAADAPAFVYSPHLSFWRSRDPSRLDPLFLRYWARSAEFVNQLRGMAASTDMSLYLSLVDQRRLRITLPTIEAQRQVGVSLGALDDKIELNRRMNKTLEALFATVTLQTNDRSPARFGDLVSSEREIVGSSEIRPQTAYIALEHMPRRSIALSEWESADSVTSAKARFRRGDILFGKLRPYFHKVGIAPRDGVCSTDILVFRAKTPQLHALALAIASSDAFVAHADATSTGTKMPRASWDDLARFEVGIPASEELARLHDVTQPLLARLAANIEESRTLAALRDALLPKLISGELRIRDAERAVAYAAGFSCDRPDVEDDSIALGIA